MDNELTINQMLDEIEYQVKQNNELSDTVKEGLKIILNKIKDSKKLK